MIERFHAARKAVIAAAGLALLVANDEGVAAAEDVPQLVIALVTLAGVYLARNK